MILPPFPRGHRNGRLTVIRFQRDPTRPKYPFYVCRCDCGKETQVTRANLARTHSCGCIKIEMLKAKATHGLSSSSEYRTWCDMRERCSRCSNVNFAHYGAKGITVCQRWLDSFESFYADMGPKPTPKHSIDRIDPSGNYEPSNCRWATDKEQRVNQRRVELITFDGFTGTLKDHAARLGVSYNALMLRRHPLGWPIEKILTTPVQHRRRSKKA